MVPWVGLQCVIVVFLDHTSLLLSISSPNQFETKTLWEASELHADLNCLNCSTFISQMAAMMVII